MGKQAEATVRCSGPVQPDQSFGKGASIDRSCLIATGIHGDSITSSRWRSKDGSRMFSSLDEGEVRDR